MSKKSDIRRTTRNHSKKDHKSDKADEWESEEEDPDQDTHSAILPCPEVIEEDKFNNQTSELKMAELASAVNGLISKITEMDVAINHDTDGIHTRLTTIQTLGDSLQTQQQKITTDITNNATSAKNNAAEIVNIKNENIVLRGIVQRQQNQLQMMNEKIAMLTAKSMDKNITISGIQEATTPKENCKMEMQLKTKLL